MNSLHAIKAFAACTIVAMVFAGCSEDQTSLDVNSVPGRAKIIGSLTYSEGLVEIDGQFKELIKPAANKEVVFTVPNSAYTGNQNNQGNSVFKTTTDANGKYEIEIPASIVEETPISIKPADFTGNFYRVIRKNNEFVTDTVLAVYHVNQTPSVTETLYPNQICFSDLTYTNVDMQDIEEGYTEYVTLNGRIGMGKERYYPAVTMPGMGIYEGETILVSAPTVKPYFDNAPNVKLLITINYNNRERLFNCTTNASGNFSLDIPVKEYPASLTYYIDAIPFASTYQSYEEIEKKWGEGETALYTIDYTPVTKTGYYYNIIELMNQLPVFKEITYNVKGETHSVEAKMMAFQEYKTDKFNDNTPWIEDLDKEDK